MAQMAPFLIDFQIIGKKSEGINVKRDDRFFKHVLSQSEEKRFQTLMYKPAALFLKIVSFLQTKV